MSGKKSIRSRWSDDRAATSPSMPPTMLVEPVAFEYFDSTAHKICLAGTFNNWDADGIEMIPMGDGRWARILLLPPGPHEYRFINDGKKMSMKSTL